MMGEEEEAAGAAKGGGEDEEKGAWKRGEQPKWTCSSCTDLQDTLTE